MLFSVQVLYVDMLTLPSQSFAGGHLGWSLPHDPAIGILIQITRYTIKGPFLAVCMSGSVISFETGSSCVSQASFKFCK